MVVANDTVYVVGTFEDDLDFGNNAMTAAGTETDIFIAALNGDTGAHVWSKQFGNNTTQFGQGLAVHSGGDIFMTGYGSGQIDFGGATLTGGADEDIFLARFEPSGAHVTSWRFGDGSDQRGRDVAVGPNNELLLVADLEGSVNLVNASATSPTPTVLAASFHESGEALWAHTIGTDVSPTYRLRVNAAPNGDVFMFSAGFEGKLVRMSR